MPFETPEVPPILTWILYAGWDEGLAYYSYLMTRFVIGVKTRPRNEATNAATENLGELCE